MALPSFVSRVLSMHRFTPAWEEWKSFFAEAAQTIAQEMEPRLSAHGANREDVGALNMGYVLKSGLVPLEIIRGLRFPIYIYIFKQKTSNSQAEHGILKTVQPGNLGAPSSVASYFF